MVTRPSIKDCPKGCNLESLHHLLSSLPIDAAVKSSLVQHYGAPDRHYHGLQHLDVLWRRHSAFREKSRLRHEDDLPIALVIAFHDAVYVSGAADNETRSAELWLSSSAHGEVCEDVRQWVAETILATADHLAAACRLDLDRPDHRARQWLLDLDLTPLGEDVDVFEANMVDLAAEMTSDTAAWRHNKLMASLRHFARAQPLYRSPALHEAFEAQAQANIARALEHDRRCCSCT